MRAGSRWWRVVVAAAVLAACTGPGGDDDREAEGTTSTSAPAVVADLDVPDADHCDPLDPAHCLLPFPSSRFEFDGGADTDTRVLLTIPDAAMPANVDGTRADADAWGGNDGWSPSTPILAAVPGVDLAASGAAPVTDIGSSLDPDAPIVIVDARTGERWPHWAEMDAATAGTDAPVLTVHPAVALTEGHRFVVGLRNLVDGDGEAIPAGEVFAAYRDGTVTAVAEVEDRRPAMEDVFATLAGAGVERDDLYLAWEFTVASERNLSERLLRMRDDALASFDGGAPAFTVAGVEEAPEPGVARRVTGTFDVPLYLDGGGASGSALALDDHGLPVRQGDYPARFVCLVPDAALAAPGQPIVYGHGLLGSAEEVDAYGALADEGNLVMCATDWLGMSGDDLGNVARILADLSWFPTLADRTQQGILNMVVLGRMLNADDGFAADPAFQGDGGLPLFRVGEVAFNGNSQGGIMGGAATAVSTEWTRAVLGVPGMGYATLLPRSIDWDPFSDLLDDAYPDPLDRAVGLGLIQALWDRGESSGYAQHMTDDPYEGTPAHDVLLVEAFGDHQVANVGTEVMARTIGAAVRQPALADGRSTDVEPFWGLDAVPSFPYDGSALVVWDFGTPAPPTDPVPPRPPEHGDDPHGMARGEPRAVEQVLRFLAPDGELGDVCGGDPCRAAPS